MLSRELSGEKSLYALIGIKGLVRVRVINGEQADNRIGGSVCGVGCDALALDDNMAFRLTSTAFSEGQRIPSKYTCEGEDISPPLTWSGVPDGTKSFVLIADDPDAPDPRAPKMIWVHWVVYNIPSDTAVLPEGAATKGLPEGARHGVNDWKFAGHGGPAPPIGQHRYFYKLYALDIVLEGREGMTKADVVATMAGHVLAEAVLMGTYEKLND